MYVARLLVLLSIKDYVVLYLQGKKVSRKGRMRKPQETRRKVLGLGYFSRHRTLHQECGYWYIELINFTDSLDQCDETLKANHESAQHFIEEMDLLVLNQNHTQT